MKTAILFSACAVAGAISYKVVETYWTGTGWMHTGAQVAAAAIVGAGMGAIVAAL